MPDKKYKIVIIGAGNVATHLGFALKKAGHTILQVVSAHPSSALELATKLKTKFPSNIKKINLTADIYIIAVNDKAILKVVKLLEKKNKIIVHTSGATHIKVLQKATDNFGVFYPVQTFTKEREIDFSNIPILIEASNEYTYETLFSVAKSICKNSYAVDTANRKKIHLAAVFVNNFTNHLYVIADDILSANEYGFNLLEPLIEETAHIIKDKFPVNLQTGPAIRGDKKTMKAHIKLLADNKDYQNIYKLLSKSIIKSSKNKK